jgi:hypothetical protein
MREQKTYRQALPMVILILCALMVLLATKQSTAKSNVPVGMFEHDYAAAPSVVLFPDEREPFGKTINEWTAEWWQYVLSIPFNPNPLFDATGGYCTIVQHGPVWFLEGNIPGAEGVIRTCSIPEGKALFFPLINVVDINVASQSVRELRAEVAGCLDAVTTLSLRVDGEALPSRLLWRSRVRSIPFAAVIPPEGVPTMPPLPAAIYSPAVDDGYYVMLKPLPVGTHTLSFIASSRGCDYVPTGFNVDPWSVDVIYQLTVVPVALR